MKLNKAESRPLLALVTAGLAGLSAPLASVGAEKNPDIDLNCQWAEQMFVERPGEMKPANQLVIVHEDVAGDTKLGRCAAGGPLRLGDTVYAHGIGVNSRSALRISLQEPAKTFSAVIGLDRNVDGTPASVRFHVQVGGEDVFATEVIRAGAAPRSITVPLGGATQVDLVVDDGGDGRGWDQADWAEGKILFADGSTVRLEACASGARPNPGLPFSFVYGGEPSSKFLASWTRELREEKVSETAQRRILTLTDPKSGLEVSAVCTIYLDTAGVDWTVHFTNKGNTESPVLEEIRALDTDVTVGPASKVTLHRLNGAPCAVDDWMPFDQTVSPGQRIHFSATNGRSSNVSPWFNTDWGEGGVITAIGWSGQWATSVELKEGKLHTEAGLQNLRTILHPGEKIRSPRILQLYWRGGDEARSYNLFRRTMLAHITPRINGRNVLPPIVHLSTSFYELNHSNEQNVLSHLNSLQGLGFEMFWLDAYWTGPKGFPESMGNYGFPIERVEPKDRFPHGIRAIAEAVEKAGLQYLMWFEPERVAPGTFIAKEHPDWVISPSGDGSGLYNLGIPEARKYMTDYLNAVVKAYRLSCLRIDYNIDPLGFWQFMDAKDPNRIGMCEMRYVEGLYRMWDDVLAANPNLFIDDCASGGRRVDLETMSRSVPLWRSDNTCDMLDGNPATISLAAIKNQLMSAGLNRYVPFSVVGQMGADPYHFRSGFNAGIAFAQDIRPKEYPKELLRQGIAEGKRIRKYFSGDFYVLSVANTNPRDWCVMQYHRSQEHDGMIMAFRRDQSPYGSYDLSLRQIDPTRTYEVTRSVSYQPEKPARMKGADLRRLKLEVSEAPGSLILEYRRIAE
jgi:alpha-galactosidase